MDYKRESAIIQMKDPKNILITGASSGIGEAVAQLYAAPGVVLAISGRNKARLEKVAKTLKDKGAVVYSKVIDVTDEKAMAAWIADIDKKAPLDLVIANAGVGVQQGDFDTMHDAASFTIGVNVGGVFNTVHPALNWMKKRGRGQVAIVSSLAGYIGLPGSPMYSASKNAVRAYGEALRPAYALKGIEINVICPGWVKSRITDRNQYKMPFFMEVDKAAKIIVKGLAKNKGRISFPWQMVGLIKFMTILPISWGLFILAKVTMKGRS